jgi:curli biogenesis system outer membrane secretion channel CsgG
MSRKLLLSCVAFVVLASASGPAFGASGLLKSSTKTKTSDDAAGAKMGDYAGVKHAVGVLDFENTGNFFTDMGLGENMRLMLESSLFATNRFVIVERGELGAVLAEQDLQASKRSAAAGSVAQTGQVRSARYLATGAITEASSSTSGDDAGVRIKGFKIGGASTKASVVAVVKLIDTSSGEVVASQRLRGEAGKSGLKIGYSDHRFGGTLGSFAKTPLGEAAQDCIDQATKFIASAMEDFAIEGSVVTVARDEVIVNLGENRGMKPGLRFMVRQDGELLLDPETGEVLDRIEGEVTGTIEIARVREKISYCKLVEGEMPERGATVVLK